MRCTTREIAVFAMFGALMYASKMLMEALPNIHLLAAFTTALTLVYRQKALYPIYAFVFITGLLGGFALWWIPYLYVWAVLWAVVMLLPRELPPKAAPLIYMFVCALHGLFYGVLYAPSQAVLFGLDFHGALAWVAAGFSFDIIHAISNFFCGALVLPLVRVMRLCEKM